jgi:hypothetical protein
LSKKNKQTQKKGDNLLFCYESLVLWARIFT